ncbi:MAG: MFS transporter [Candidatus Omnitrophica bacterium]|nr:MFS transporter [Candidatus Omnitrophota bacterium]
MASAQQNLSPRRLSLNGIFRALKHRNFRLFFFGQLVSLVGTWMQTVAMAWLVYRLTNSPFLLGCVGFSLSFPAIIFSPLAGLSADRFDRRKILFMVQALSMLQAAILTVLIFTHSIQIWQVMTLSVFLGILNAFDLPVRQTFFKDMIEDKNDLSNAIALNSSVFNASRLIGPAAAGMIIALWGEAACFLCNAISFIPILLALSMMRMPKRVRKAGQGDVMRELKEGVRYAFGFMPIRAILLLLCALSLLMGAFQTLLPVFTKEVFGGGPKTLGFLLSFSGAGALVGAFWLAGRQTVVGLGRHVAVAGMAAGTAMMSFAVLADVHLASLAALASGLAMILGIGGSNIILQSLVDEDKRGRVMSLYGLALVGMAPVGSLAAGILATRVGIVGTMVLAGSLATLAGFLFWLYLPHFRAKVRPVYVEKGILSQV